MLRPTLLYLILSLPLIGCGVTGSDSDNNSEPDRQLSRELSAQETMIAEGSNDFAFRLLNMLQEKEGAQSFFVSPLSISTAFAMALNGAEGETYEQMRDFFGHEGMSRKEINQAYFDLIELLVNLDPQVTMNIANSVWIRENFPVKEDFLDVNREYFDAEATELDFNRADAPDIINSWIEDKTEGLIEEMIDEIGADVIMYLINAIYFQGDWKIQFDPEETQDAPFHLSDGTTTEVPMMRARSEFRYYEDDNWTALDMWYGDAGYSFTALLPNTDQSLEELGMELDEPYFSQITDELIEDTVQVFVPKFELDYPTDDFVADLENMGLTLPFDQNRADFSGIAHISDAQRIYISDVMHRAVIKLDEEGSEAAAATVIEFEVTSANGGSRYKTIRLDRPFLFFIRENSSNTILFMGAYQGA